MNKQKQVWEDLAQKNYKYYINTDFGKNITEEQFEGSGLKDYQELIINDGLIFNKNTILDYGCGAGRMMRFMAKDFKNVIGVDISPTMIAQSRSRLKDINNIKLIETDGNKISLPDSSVDFVFAYHVFQHIKERSLVENTLAEIFRILKEGGIFKVLLRSDKQKDMGNWWSGVEYNENEVKKLAEGIGYKHIKTYKVDENSYWFWIQKQTS